MKEIGPMERDGPIKKKDHHKKHTNRKLPLDRDQEQTKEPSNNLITFLEVQVVNSNNKSQLPRLLRCPTVKLSY